MEDLDMNELRYRQVHLDFHTSEYIPMVAQEFDAEKFADTLKKSKYRLHYLLRKMPSWMGVLSFKENTGAYTS